MERIHTYTGDYGQISFLACFNMVCYDMFCLPQHMKIQNAEQDQGYRLAREEFHSCFSAPSALLCRISVVWPVVSSWQCRSDSNWFENEKKSLSIDLALDRGFDLWMKFLTVCAERSCCFPFRIGRGRGKDKSTSGKDTDPLKMCPSVLILIRMQLPVQMILIFILCFLCCFHHPKLLYELNF